MIHTKNILIEVIGFYKLASNLKMFIILTAQTISKHISQTKVGAILTVSL